MDIVIEYKLKQLDKLINIAHYLFGSNRRDIYKLFIELGDIYLNMQEYNKAHEFYERSLIYTTYMDLYETLEKVESIERLLRLSTHYGTLLFMLKSCDTQNRSAYVYLLLDEYFGEGSMEYIKKADEIADNTNKYYFDIKSRIIAKYIKNYDFIDAFYILKPIINSLPKQYIIVAHILMILIFDNDILGSFNIDIGYDTIQEHVISNELITAYLNKDSDSVVSTLDKIKELYDIPGFSELTEILCYNFVNK